MQVLVLLTMMFLLNSKKTKGTFLIGLDPNRNPPAQSVGMEMDRTLLQLFEGLSFTLSVKSNVLMNQCPNKGQF